MTQTSTGIHPLMCGDPECQPDGAKATVEMTPVRVEDNCVTLYRCPKGHHARRRDPQITDLAVRAFDNGDDDAAAALLTVDGDLRALHIAWHDAARADQDAAMAGGGDWFDNVMPEPSVAQQAAHAAYQERLEFLAGCR
jgi:hypothetical protein